MDGYRLYSSLADCGYLQKYAEIDLSALRKNYSVLRARLLERTPTLRAIAVVKADAYGHGAQACVRALVREGCDFFAVSCIEEAITVRRECDALNCGADVLILGYTDARATSLLSEYRLIQTVCSEEHALALDAEAVRIGARIRVHAAINTGMNRIGLNARSAEEIGDTADALVRIGGLRGLDVCGMFTHFSSADEQAPAGEEATARQMARYRALRDALSLREMTIPFHHVCNSAAAVRGVAELFDGARLGILLYGVYPALAGELPLTPVMRLCAHVVHVFDLPAGECVGYGGEFSSAQPRRIAVIGIGYADGWIRAYTGVRVRVFGESGTCDVPVVGRICMDQCMLDVTDANVCVGDLVVLFGDGCDQLAALSSHVGSIDYEALCIVSSRVSRVYKNA